MCTWSYSWFESTVSDGLASTSVVRFRYSRRKEAAHGYGGREVLWEFNRLLHENPYPTGTLPKRLQRRPAPGPHRPALLIHGTACKGRVGGADGAAARLGMNRTTLLSRMRKFGIYAKQYA
jgi:hypothetical protein